MNSSIYKRIAIEIGIDEKLAKEAYLMYWKFIRETISSLTIPENMTEKEFDDLKHVIPVPHIGKFYIKSYNSIKNRRTKEYARVEKG